MGAFYLYNIIYYFYNGYYYKKRNGTIQKLANGDYKFMTEVYDASEMVPWIKTFTGRIVEIKCSNERVEKQIKEDFEMMKRIYEVR